MGINNLAKSLLRLTFFELVDFKWFRSYGEVVLLGTGVVCANYIWRCLELDLGAAFFVKTTLYCR